MNSKTAYLLLEHKIVDGFPVFHRAGIYSERFPTCRLAHVHTELLSCTQASYEQAKAAMLKVIAEGYYAWVMPLLGPNDRAA